MEENTDQPLTTPLGNPRSETPGSENVTAGAPASIPTWDKETPLEDITKQYTDLGSNFIEIAENAADNVGDRQVQLVGNDFGATNPYMYNTYYEPAANEFASKMRQQGTQFALEEGLDRGEEEAKKRLNAAKNAYSNALAAAKEAQKNAKVHVSETDMSKMPADTTEQEVLKSEEFKALSDEDKKAKLEQIRIQELQNALDAQDSNVRNWDDKTKRTKATDYTLKERGVTREEYNKWDKKKKDAFWADPKVGNTWTKKYMMLDFEARGGDEAETLKEEFNDIQSDVNIIVDAVKNNTVSSLTKDVFVTSVASSQQVESQDKVKEKLYKNIHDGNETGKANSYDQAQRAYDEISSGNAYQKDGKWYLKKKNGFGADIEVKLEGPAYEYSMDGNKYHIYDLMKKVKDADAWQKFANGEYSDLPSVLESEKSTKYSKKSTRRDTTTTEGLTTTQILDNQLRNAFGVDYTSLAALADLKKNKPDDFEYLLNQSAYVLSAGGTPFSVVSDRNKKYFINGKWWSAADDDSPIKVGDLIMHTIDGTVTKDGKYRDPALKNFVELYQKIYTGKEEATDENKKLLTSYMNEYQTILSASMAASGRQGMQVQEDIYASLLSTRKDADLSDLKMFNPENPDEEISLDDVKKWFSSFNEDQQYNIYTAITKRASSHNGYYYIYDEKSGAVRLVPQTQNGVETIGKYGKTNDSANMEGAKMVEKFSDDQCFALKIFLDNQMKNNKLSSTFFDNDEVSAGDSMWNQVWNGARGFFTMLGSAGKLGFGILFNDKQSRIDAGKMWDEMTTLDKFDNMNPAGGSSRTDAVLFNEYTEDARKMQRSNLNHLIDTTFNLEYFNPENEYDPTTGEMKDKNGKVIGYSDNHYFHNDVGKAITDIAWGMAGFVAEAGLEAAATGGAKLLAKSALSGVSKTRVGAALASKFGVLGTTLTDYLTSEATISGISTTFRSHQAEKFVKTSQQILRDPSTLSILLNEGTSVMDDATRILYAEAMQGLSTGADDVAKAAIISNADNLAVSAAESAADVVGTDLTSQAVRTAATHVDETGKLVTGKIGNWVDDIVEEADDAATAIAEGSMAVEKGLSDDIVKDLGEGLKDAKQVFKEQYGVDKMLNAVVDNTDNVARTASQKIADYIEDAFRKLTPDGQRLAKSVYQQIDDISYNSIKRAAQNVTLSEASGISVERIAKLDQRTTNVLYDILRASRGSEVMKTDNVFAYMRYRNVFNAAGADAAKGTIDFAKAVESVVNASEAAKDANKVLDVADTLRIIARNSEEKGALITNLKRNKFWRDRIYDYAQDIYQGYRNPELDENFQSHYTSIQDYVTDPTQWIMGGIFDGLMSGARKLTSNTRLMLNSRKLNQLVSNIEFDGGVQADSAKLSKNLRKMNKLKYKVDRLTDKAFDGSLSYDKVATASKKAADAIDDQLTQITDHFDMKKSLDFMNDNIKSAAAESNVFDRFKEVTGFGQTKVASAAEINRLLVRSDDTLRAFIYNSDALKSKAVERFAKRVYGSPNTAMFTDKQFADAFCDAWEKTSKIDFAKQYGVTNGLIKKDGKYTHTINAADKAEAKRLFRAGQDILWDEFYNALYAHKSQFGNTINWNGLKTEFKAFEDEILEIGFEMIDDGKNVRWNYFPSQGVLWQSANEEPEALVGYIYGAGEHTSLASNIPNPLEERDTIDMSQIVSDHRSGKTEYERKLSFNEELRAKNKGEVPTSKMVPYNEKGFNPIYALTAYTNAYDSRKFATKFIDPFNNGSIVIADDDMLNARFVSEKTAKEEALKKYRSNLEEGYRKDLKVKVEQEDIVNSLNEARTYLSDKKLAKVERYDEAIKKQRSKIRDSVTENNLFKQFAKYTGIDEPNNATIAKHIDDRFAMMISDINAVRGKKPENLSALYSNKNSVQYRSLIDGMAKNKEIRKDLANTAAHVIDVDGQNLHVDAFNSRYYGVLGVMEATQNHINYLDGLAKHKADIAKEISDRLEDETFTSWVNMQNEAVMNMDNVFTHVEATPPAKAKAVEIFSGNWTAGDVKRAKDKVFLFGDNIEDAASGYVPIRTQAVIRGQENAIGIPTKKNRGYFPSSYFTDADFDEFKTGVDNAITKAKKSGKTIVLPENGIGTGAAQLKQRAPKCFEYLQEQLDALKKYNPASSATFEASTAGHKEFSALNAKFAPGTKIMGVDISGRTIEDVYQKTLKGSSKNQAPTANSPIGKATASLEKKTGKTLTKAQKEAVSQKYMDRLWDIWGEQNPELKAQIENLPAGTKITDQFAKTGVSQANSLQRWVKPAQATVETAKRPVLNITPDKKIDAKAKAKGSVSNKFIGFADGIEGSSTAKYAQQAGDMANTGDYNPADVVFVSVPGKRGAVATRRAAQDKTIAEAIKALDNGATIVTDSAGYLAKSPYNEGEIRLADTLKKRGYNYSDTNIDGYNVGVWSKGTVPTVNVEWKEYQRVPKYSAADFVTIRDVDEKSRREITSMIYNIMVEKYGIDGVDGKKQFDSDHFKKLVNQFAYDAYDSVVTGKAFEDGITAAEVINEFNNKFPDIDIVADNNSSATFDNILTSLAVYQNAGGDATLLGNDIIDLITQNREGKINLSDEELRRLIVAYREVFSAAESGERITNRGGLDVDIDASVKQKGEEASTIGDLIASTADYGQSPESMMIAQQDAAEAAAKAQAEAVEKAKKGKYDIRKAAFYENVRQHPELYSVDSKLDAETIARNEKVRAEAEAYFKDYPEGTKILDKVVEDKTVRSPKKKAQDIENALNILGKYDTTSYSRKIADAKAGWNTFNQQFYPKYEAVINDINAHRPAGVKPLTLVKTDTPLTGTSDSNWLRILREFENTENSTFRIGNKEYSRKDVAKFLKYGIDGKGAILDMDPSKLRAYVENNNIQLSSVGRKALDEMNDIDLGDGKRATYAEFAHDFTDANGRRSVSSDVESVRNAIVNMIAEDTDPAKRALRFDIDALGITSNADSMTIPDNYITVADADGSTAEIRLEVDYGTGSEGATGSISYWFEKTDADGNVTKYTDIDELVDTLSENLDRNSIVTALKNKGINIPSMENDRRATDYFARNGKWKGSYKNGTTGVDLEDWEIDKNIRTGKNPIISQPDPRKDILELRKKLAEFKDLPKVSDKEIEIVNKVNAWLKSGRSLESVDEGWRKIYKKSAENVEKTLRRDAIISEINILQNTNTKQANGWTSWLADSLDIDVTNDSAKIEKVAFGRDGKVGAFDRISDLTSKLERESTIVKTKYYHAIEGICHGLATIDDSDGGVFEIDYTKRDKVLKMLHGLRDDVAKSKRIRIQDDLLELLDNTIYNVQKRYDSVDEFVAKMVNNNPAYAAMKADLDDSKALTKNAGQIMINYTGDGKTPIFVNSDADMAGRITLKQLREARELVAMNKDGKTPLADIGNRRKDKKIIKSMREGFTDGYAKKQLVGEASFNKQNNWIDNLVTVIKENTGMKNIDESKIYVDRNIASLGQTFFGEGTAGWQEKAYSVLTALTSFNQTIQDVHLAGGVGQYNAFTLRNALTMMWQDPIGGARALVDNFRNARDNQAVVSFLINNSDKLIKYALDSGDFSAINKFAPVITMRQEAAGKGFFSEVVSSIMDAPVTIAESEHKLAGFGKSIKNVYQAAFNTPTFARWTVIANADLTLRNYNRAAKYVERLCRRFGLTEKDFETMEGGMGSKDRYIATLARLRTEMYWKPQEFFKTKFNAQKYLEVENARTKKETIESLRSLPKATTAADAARSFFFALNYKLQMNMHPVHGIGSVLSTAVNGPRMSAQLGSRSTFSLATSRFAGGGNRNEALTLLGLAVLAHSWNTYIGAPSAWSQLWSDTSTEEGEAEPRGLAKSLMNFQDFFKVWIPDPKTGRFNPDSSWSLDPAFSIFTLQNSVAKGWNALTNPDAAHISPYRNDFGLQNWSIGDWEIGKGIEGAADEVIGANLLAGYKAGYEVLNNNTYFGNNVWEQPKLPDGSDNPNFDLTRNLIASVAHILNLDGALEGNGILGNGTNRWVKGLDIDSITYENGHKLEAPKTKGLAIGKRGVYQDKTGTVSGSGLIQHEYTTALAAINDGDYFEALSGSMELPFKSRSYTARARTALNSEVTQALRRARKEYEMKCEGATSDAKEVAYAQFAKKAVSIVKRWSREYGFVLGDHDELVASATKILLGFMAGEYNDTTQYMQNMYMHLKQELKMAEGDKFLFSEEAAKEAMAAGMSPEEAAATWNKHLTALKEAQMKEYKARVALEEAGIDAALGTNVFDSTEFMHDKFQAEKATIDKKLYTELNGIFESKIGEFKNFEEMKKYYEELIKEAGTTKQKAKLAEKYNKYVTDAIAPYLKEYGGAVLNSAYWDGDYVTNHLGKYIIIPANQYYNGTTPRSSYLRDQLGIGFRDSKNLPSDKKIKENINEANKALASGRNSSAAALVDAALVQLRKGVVHASPEDYAKLIRMRALLSSRRK